MVLAILTHKIPRNDHGAHAHHMQASGCSYSVQSAFPCPEGIQLCVEAGLPHEVLDLIPARTGSALSILMLFCFTCMRYFVPRLVMIYDTEGLAYMEWWSMWSRAG